MSAARTFAAWKDFARASSGGENLFRVGTVAYAFDAHPRPLGNGALQGRLYRQDPGELSRDIGGFKIDAAGTVVAIPDELRDVLPASAPAEVERPDPFSTDDTEGSLL